LSGLAAGQDRLFPPEEIRMPITSLQLSYDFWTHLGGRPGPWGKPRGEARV